MQRSYDTYSSPIGILKIISENGQLIGIESTKETNRSYAIEQSTVSILVKNWLDQYFQGNIHSSSDIPVKLIGTEFQQYVWNILQSIPFGQTLTYGQIAQKTAKHFGSDKMSAQAIGQAVSKNPILILIPCHRVIGANQKITGFSAGIELKKWLLDHEKIPYKA